MSKRSCFVIMPFTTTTASGRSLTKKDLDFIYNEIIIRAVAEYKIKDKQLFSTISRYNSNIGSIVTGIAKELNTADLVIADLTGLNPNVMYELGVRHTLKRGTIIITQDITSLPSDLRDYMCLEYQFSRDSVKQNAIFQTFKNVLHRTINELLSTNKYDSPVLSYLKGKERYWKEDEIKKLRESIVIGAYIIEKYDEIKDTLNLLKSSSTTIEIETFFAQSKALIDNLGLALSDLDIPIETAILYEDTLAARQLVAEIQQRYHYADYFSKVLPAMELLNFDKSKSTFFNEKFTDYFALNLGSIAEITMENVFSDEGDFFEDFLKPLEKYLTKRMKELGLTQKEVDFMLVN